MRQFLVVVATALLAQPSIAFATDPPGTYVVSSCQLGNQPIQLSGWRQNDSSGRKLVNSCGHEAGYFGAGTGGQESWLNGESYGWLWDAPKDAVVAGVRVWGGAGSSNLIAAGLRAGDDWVSISSARSLPLERLDLNTTHLILGLTCGDPEGCFENDPPPDIPWVQVTRLEILLRDLLPPEAVGTLRGSLLQAGPLSGVVSVGTDYRDRGGGMRSMGLLVDGKLQADKVITSDSCRQPSAQPVPCPLSGRIDLEFDTTAIPDGDHRVELELRDVAGNRSLVGPFPIVIRNAPPVPQAAPPPTPGRLTLVRYSVKAKFGARVVLEGTLVDLGEAPIAAAQVDVASRPLLPNSVFVQAGSVLTDAAGHFTVPIPLGPSRVFRLRYASSETRAQVVIPAPVRLKVSPSATRNGKSIRFKGSIPGTDAGTRVELQARAGRKWVPFRTAMVSKGHFSARYKFTNTNTTQRYRFRAVVRKDPNFPYAAGTSPTVKVLVRP
jgi:hypothetical protein